MSSTPAPVRPEETGFLGAMSRLPWAATLLPRLCQPGLSSEWKGASPPGRAGSRACPCASSARSPLSALSGLGAEALPARHPQGVVQHAAGHQSLAVREPGLCQHSASARDGKPFSPDASRPHRGTGQASPRHPTSTRQGRPGRWPSLGFPSAPMAPAQALCPRPRCWVGGSLFWVMLGDPGSAGRAPGAHTPGTGLGGLLPRGHPGMTQHGESSPPAPGSAVGTAPWRMLAVIRIPVRQGAAAASSSHAGPGEPCSGAGTEQRGLPEDWGRAGPGRLEAWGRSLRHGAAHGWGRWRGTGRTLCRAPVWMEEQLRCCLWGNQGCVGAGGSSTPHLCAMP